MKKTAALFAVILCVTFVGHVLFWYFGTPSRLVEKTKFYDYDSFLTYIEEDDGSQISGQDYPRFPITVDGKVVLEYTHRRLSAGVMWNTRSEDALPISVFSMEDYGVAHRVRNIMNWVFWGLYVTEITAAVITAHKRKKKEAQ